MEQVVNNFVNSSHELVEFYIESKSQIFQYREQAQSQLDAMLKWQRTTEEQIKFYKFLINKAQHDESYNIYLEKLEKNLKDLEKKLEESYDPVEKVTKIVDDYNEVIDKYFTEEITEDGGAIINPTTIEYLKISSKIVILG